jgi:hypothetical protein
MSSTGNMAPTSVSSEEFEERAAIMQFEGGMTRWEAERLAKLSLAEQKGLFDAA